MPVGQTNLPSIVYGLSWFAELDGLQYLQGFPDGKQEVTIPTKIIMTNLSLMV